MDYQDILKRKLISAEEAAKKIKSNDRVVVGLGCSAPPKILQSLVKRQEELKGVIVDQMLPSSSYGLYESGVEKHIRHNSWFSSKVSRPLVNSGAADFTPNYFSQIPGLYKKYVDVDVLLATVSPMDRHGYFSFGVSIDYTKKVAEQAALVILEVNENMPRTLGDSFIHVNDVDYLVNNNQPLPELTINPSTETEQKIGSYVAKLIEDGSTIQLGIGGIPNAIAQALVNKKDLGVHSEMLTEGMVDLVEKGIINNKKKSLHPGKIIGAFASGTKKLYDFLDDNPIVEMHPVSYVNDTVVISRNNQMISINSAIEIDLLGQCCSESVGVKQISASGGQVDFIRGALRSPGGKSIIALKSTAMQGKKSTIVPILEKGAVVTTSKNEVNYVVTEYGIAQLRGKTARERAVALIEIAHPSFRDELKAQAPYLY